MVTSLEKKEERKMVSFSFKRKDEYCYTGNFSVLFNVDKDFGLLLYGKLIIFLVSVMDPKMSLY